MKKNSCWAECLGGCSDKLSREHVISAALFTADTVRVHGFPWCKEKPVDIGLASLTAKILCTAHNSQLSPVDTAGAQAFDVFREMMRLSQVRRAMKPRHWNIKRYTINGRMLERWFLKTMLNLCSNHEFPIGRASTISGSPTDQLVSVAFGLSEFQHRAGLFSIARPGMQLHSDDTVGFAPLIKQANRRIEGGLFTFRGYRFLLFLEPEGPPQPLSGVYFGGEDVGHSHLNFHLDYINEDLGKFRSQVITFDWNKDYRT